MSSPNSRSRCRSRSSPRCSACPRRAGPGCATGRVVCGARPVLDPETPGADPGGRQGMRMVREVIAWKRANPADDLLTALIARRGRRRPPADDGAGAQVTCCFRGGPRDHGQPDRQRHPRLLRQPRAARAAARRARRCAGTPSTSCSATTPGPDDATASRAPTPSSAARRSPGHVRHRRPRPRPTATRRSRGADAPTQLDSAGRTPPSTCRSAAVPTTASAPRWPGSRPGSWSIGWSPASPTATRRSSRWNGRINLRGLAT